jgi:hypothetical protein
MKKLIILTVIAFAALTELQAQPSITKSNEDTIGSFKSTAFTLTNRAYHKEIREMRESEVSFMSKQNFASDFGNLHNVAWVHRDGFDEATFRKGGKTETAFYDDNSKLVGTTTPKSFIDLPLKARRYIDGKYIDYIKGPVIFFKDNELNNSPMSIYDQMLNNMDSYFIELKKYSNEKVSNKIVLQILPDGSVYYFTTIKK